MSVIHYENLTWPEIAALPRDLPLVLPIGTAYSEAYLGRALGLDDYCILPAIPYGWNGSGIDVGEAMFNRVVTGIFFAPQQEHFQRLYCVYADPINLNVPNVNVVRLDYDLPYTPVTLHATPQRVILIPCGHTEQHGYHLPMNTDTLIIGAIAEKTVHALPDEAEMLPTLPYGVSMYRSSFAGTFNIGGRVFEDFLLAVLDVLIARGADRFYLMSGHGGNSSFLHNVVKYIGDRHHHVFAATAFLHTSGHLGGPALEQYRQSKRGGMGHACELETAYILHLRPDLVHMDRVIDEIDFISTPNYWMDWIEGGALILSHPWEDDTLTGAYGAGSVATSQNGAQWMKIAIQEKIEHVREIHEQARLRLKRRASLRDS